MITDILLGFSSYFTAMRLVKEYNLWKYLYVSGIISLAIGGLIIVVSYSVSGYIGTLLSNWYPFELGKETFAKVASIGGAMGLISLAYFAYKYIVLALLSPLMGPLSEKIETNINGPNFNNTGVLVLLKGLARGIRVSLRNITKEGIYTIVLLILGLIPGVGLISIPMLFLIQAYYVGFANMDYYSERHYNVADSARFVKLNQFYAIGNGIVFLLLIMIPIAGLFFAPCLATIAATHTIVTSPRIKRI